MKTLTPKPLISFVRKLAGSLHAAPDPKLDPKLDDRGAVLTFGVFIAPFLVAAVYYVVATANVMMQREGLQSAADASAFAPAVVSARAMNAIAVMNVLMMCIMSIVIPVRALLPAYSEVASWSCYEWCTCAIVSDAGRASGQLAQKAINVEQKAKDLLTALSDAQESIAERAPKQGVEAARASAQRTAAFLESNARPDVYSSSLTKDGCRLGLPVEEDTFRTVCERTKPYVWEIAFRIAGPTLQTLGGCKSGGWALALAANDLSNPTNPQVCREAMSSPCSGSGPHPKKVFKDASNGSDHMQYWAKVQGRSFDNPRTGVEVGHKKKGSEPPRDLDIGFAQSEIYFDCSGGWSSCNKKEDAMWNTKWTARLRRVHKPGISFSNDNVVRQELTDPAHWKSVRSAWLDSRVDFTTGKRAATEAASTLMSSDEGPLQ